MNEIFSRLLSPLSPGAVLDVATSEGGFVGVLKQHLKSYGQITAIDIDQERLDTARQRYPDENIQFLRMDAASLDFPDAQFDLAAIGVSLHHLPDIPAALAEMQRVLKPGGQLFLAEMHTDSPSEASRSLALLHQWAADVDSAEGIPHNHTLPRQQIIDHLKPLGFKDMQIHDSAPDDSDPLQNLQDFDLDDFIECFSARAAAAGRPDLVETGQQLKQRTLQTGIHQEPRLILLAQKP